MPFVAAMDIGGTHARIAIQYDNDNIIYHEAEGFTLLQDGKDKVLQKLKKIIEEPLSKALQKPEYCLSLCCGAAGVDNEETKITYKNILSSLGFPSDKIYVYNDCELLLEDYEKPAALAAAGTGSISLARDHNKTIYRCGGWGFYTSDEGSACKIALDGLSKVVSAFDNVCSAPILTKLFCEANITNPMQAEAFARKAALEKNLLASLAPIICKASQEGDLEATKIIKSNAEALGAQIVQAVINARLISPDVILWGSLLLKTDALRKPLSEYLKKEINVNIVILCKTSLDAALSLANKKINI